MKKIFTLFLIFSMALGAAAQAPRHKMRKANAYEQQKVTVLPATDVTSTGFTAHWEPLEGVECYLLNVYEPVTITEAGKYILLDENFNLVNVGTQLEPYFPEENLDDDYIYFCFSDAFDWTYTPDWWAYWGVFARGMVGGYIQSPNMDLTANGGKFEVEMCVQGYQGAMVQIVSHGATEQKHDVYLEKSGENWFTVEFTNGTHDTYISYSDFGIENDPEGDYAACYDFLDDFRVYQDYEVGDVALRPVAVTPDVFGTQYLYGNLIYAYGAKHLAYDVQAVFVVPDPDSPLGEEWYYTQFSDLEHVYLEGYQDSINEITNDAESAPRYFDLQGRAVSADKARGGMFLKVTGNKTEKLFIR